MTNSNEAARQAAVNRYAILDTPRDGAFDTITSIAAHIFDVPISIVSIVDHDRIWFKSHHGLDVQQVGREPGLCASAILKDIPTIITDAKLDPHSLSNPLVAGKFGLRFYAAAPLMTADGHNLGTLCVIDKEPREVNENQMSMLQSLAAVVVDELELRLSTRELARVNHELLQHTLGQKVLAENRFQQAFDYAPIGMAVLSLDCLLIEVNVAFCQIFGYPESTLLLTAMADLLHDDDRQSCLSVFAMLASDEPQIHRAQWRGKTAEGLVVWVRVTLATVKGADDHPTRFIVQVENITQRKVDEILGSAQSHPASG